MVQNNLLFTFNVLGGSYHRTLLLFYLLRLPASSKNVPGGATEMTGKLIFFIVVCSAVLAACRLQLRSRSRSTSSSTTNQPQMV